MTKPTVDLADTIASWRTKTNTISDNVGDPSLLTTSTDSSTVAAINELVGRVDSDDTWILSVYNTLGARIDSADSSLTSLVGLLGDLTTTDKGSIVEAVNEINRRLPDIYDNTGTLLNT